LKPRLAPWLLPVALTACNKLTASTPPYQPLPQLSANATAAPRVNGYVGTPQPAGAAEFSQGQAQNIQPVSLAVTTGTGDVSLDFADTDVREVVAQILGNILHLNYTIDPAVRGTVTLRTAAPLSRAQLIPALQTLLSQNGAALVQAGGLYRVLPSAAVPGGMLAGSATAGTAVVPLRNADAVDLAKVLQPFIGPGGRIAAVPDSNALLVSGEPDSRNSLVELIRSFDVDGLAGQSYALLPVTTGGARDFATQLQDALRGQGGNALASQVRVVPMDRVDAVLVVASRPGYIEQARRIYELVAAARRSTVRSWHVYYLQNSRANDVANLLQRAFTPNNVTAQPSGGRAAGQTAPGMGTQTLTGATGASSLPATPGIGTAPGMPPTGGLGGMTGGAMTPPATQSNQSEQLLASPLLGGLGPGGGTGAETDVNAMRIVADPQNNAVLIYATRQEEETVVAMLRKIDILPLQVRIDATVAEVDLNDALQYGTQFYFRQGGVNGELTAAFNTGIPGFFLAGNNSAQVAISALQAVTQVRVLSSPQLLVLDNQPAQREVGDLVPYLTSQSQSTVAAAAVINSVSYQQTGVIMDVTPHVNSGGLVTLDISQQVSQIDSAITSSTTGINSPAFSNRTVQSRVVVQDGQTIGLAGLIQDNVSHGNTGFPILKDIPLLGVLFGQQNNTRTRTELLVLVTPHVMHDQRDARDLTEDMREQLSGSAVIPAELQHLRPSGSPDPMAPLLNRIKSAP
jgi:general secretion pathway protein D